MLEMEFVIYAYRPSHHINCTVNNVNYIIDPICLTYTCMMKIKNKTNKLKHVTAEQLIVNEILK